MKDSTDGHMAQGKLISVEGIDGGGKGSVLPAIQAALEQRGIEVVCTREPGGTPVGESVREMLLSRHTAGLSDLAELLLLFAARAQLVSEVIAPALAAGKWVLCDRFVDSSYAYQGGGRGMAVDTIRTLDDMVTDGLRPSLTILLDVSVDVGQARTAGRRAQDRFEVEEAAFFERVRAEYRNRAAADPDRFRVIDAGNPLPVVIRSAEQAIEHLLSAVSRETNES